jgi:hypothetical protein
MAERRDRLVGLLMAQPPARALDRVCRGAVEILGIRAAAVILMADRETGSVAASCGPRVDTVEDLQFALGEGPCLTAFHTGVAVLESDLTTARQRWPVFAPAAEEADVRAVFAIPLQIGAIRLGVLYLADDRAGPLAAEALADAYALAQIATVAILDEQAGGYDVLDGTAPHDGWSHRAVVHQATGMVAAQLDVALADALARLRARAFALDRSIYDVSTDVVARRLRFTQAEMDGRGDHDGS